jgi:hypothetical protein
VFASPKLHSTGNTREPSKHPTVSDVVSGSPDTQELRGNKVLKGREIQVAGVGDNHYKVYKPEGRMTLVGIVV